jgi:peptide-methionine (S)-S-oxide reductase
MKLIQLALGIIAAASLGLAGCGTSVEAAASGPDGSNLTKNGLYKVKNAPKEVGKTEVASFAAGCFWGVEAEFRKEPGVIATAVGYTGGRMKNPSYEQVCSHTTGHAEAVQVEFDPTKTSYEKMLALFWDLHDPTQTDGQGVDLGDSYRSAIFYHSESQRQAAIASRDKLQASGEFKDKIVTQIAPAAPFYKAEGYHQQYVEKGGIAACHRRKGG